MPLTKEQIEKLHSDYKNLVDFYQKKVREVIIASERLNPGQKISIPAVVEVRSAFDHVARAHAVMYGLITEKELGLSGADVYTYCDKNFDKAHGHLYRAAYDAYDVIAVSSCLEIDKLTNSFSSRALFTVIPDASEKIINPYELAKNLVTKEKLQKDVNNKAEEQEQFEQYEKATNTLKDVHDTIIAHMPALIKIDTEEAAEIAERRRKEEADLAQNRKSDLKNNWGLAIGIIGIIIGIIGWLWNPFVNTSANSRPPAIANESSTSTSPEHAPTEEMVLPSRKQDKRF